MDQKDSISEIEQLLEELESYADKSPWYTPNRIVIPDEAFFTIVQHIRELLPQELAEARKTIEKRDLILKNAQEEHKRIIESAERRLEDLTSEESVVRLAEERAGQIVEDARHRSEDIKRDALSYTVELLQDMEEQFDKTLLTIRNGRRFVEAEINKQVDSNMAGLDAVHTEQDSAASGAGEVAPMHGEE